MVDHLAFQPLRKREAPLALYWQDFGWIASRLAELFLLRLALIRQFCVFLLSSSRLIRAKS